MTRKTFQPMGLAFQSRSDQGFTVLETLVAIAVMGVAISVFLSFFRLSLTLLDSSRTERIAAHVAEEQIALITAYPQQLDWRNLWSAPVGERRSVSKIQTAEMPVTSPTDQGAYFQSKRQYEGCVWETYARLPYDGAPYVEVSVEVRWIFKARDRRFVLTTCVPRAQLEAPA